MQLNPIDRAINTLAPQWGARRMRARAQAEVIAALPSLQAMGAEEGDPALNSLAMRRGRTPRDARSDVLPTLPLERGASRYLARTAPVAVGAINTNVDRVVGTGLALSAQPNLRVLGWSSEQGQGWKRIVQAEFSLWSDGNACDQDNAQNFYEQQGVVLRGTLESGDLFSLLPDGAPSATQPYALRVQLIEADRVGNPLGEADTATTAGGVRLGQAGAQAYHLYHQHPGGWLPSGRAASLYAGQWVERVGPSGRLRMLHHYRKLRPGQPRGVPYLAPVVDCIAQISRYTRAEIMAAVISAYFTVFVETPSGAGAAPIFGAGPDEPAAGAMAQPLELAMGAVLPLQPGEKVQIANPGRPNPNFERFLLAVIKQMGIALGLPFELLTKEFNASFSASKAALLDAWVYFRGVRTWLARSFCQPVYETWLAEAVAIGRVPAPGFFADPLLRWAYTRAAWPGDSMGSINPKDEVAAYVAAIDARLMTRERAEWELWGSDWNDTFEQKAAEHAQLKAANMLPAPKAGAAAPQADDKPAAPSQGERAMAVIASAISAMAAREPPVQASAPAPVVNVAPAAITVHTPQVSVTTAPVHVAGGATHVHLRDAVHVDAHIAAPNVAVEAVLPAAQVVVAHPQRAVQRVERDPETLEVTSMVTTYEPPSLRST